MLGSTCDSLDVRVHVYSPKHIYYGLVIDHGEGGGATKREVGGV